MTVKERGLGGLSVAFCCAGLLLIIVSAAVITSVYVYPTLEVGQNDTSSKPQMFKVRTTSFTNQTGSFKFGTAGGVRHFLYGELPTMATRMLTEPNALQAIYLKQECGKPSPNIMESSVIWGEYVPFDVADFPWLMRVVVVMEGSPDRRDTTNTSHPKQMLGICGGTLIAPSWLVTARHCFSVRRTHKTVLYHPSTNTYVEYQQLYAYPGYSDLYNQNDFILVHLKAPILTKEPGTFSCLPNADVIPSRGRHCAIAGWPGGDVATTSPQLLWVTIEHPTRCQSRYCGLKYNVNVNICDKETPSARSADDKCHGFSGSPLLCLENARWVAYGVLNWSGPRCDVSKGHGFALTSTRLHWICCFVNPTDLPHCSDVEC